MLKCFNDRDNTDWSHPEIMDTYEFAANPGGFDTFLLNPEVDFDERAAAAIEAQKTLGADPEPAPEDMYRVFTFEAPGCPEEPDAPLVSFRVVKPKNLTKKKYPCIIEIAAGALVIATCCPTALQLSNLYDCVAIEVKYRTVYTGGEYPHCLNDVHAVVNYVIEHAEELNVDPKKIIVRGTSSGGLLALNLNHRLKRYGQHIRGIIAIVPTIDNRTYHPSSYIDSVSWAARENYLMDKMYTSKATWEQATSPECYASYAQVEDCVGLSPVFIHGMASDMYTDSSFEYISKLNQAGTYCEFHMWGGSNHTGLYYAETGETDPRTDEEMELAASFCKVIDCQVHTMLKNNLYRPWAVEAAKEEYANKVQ